MSINTYFNENMSRSQTEIASQVAKLLPMLELKYLEPTLRHFFNCASEDTHSALSTLLRSARCRPTDHVQTYLETVLGKELPKVKLSQIAARVTTGVSRISEGIKLSTEWYEQKWDTTNDLIPVSGFPNRHKRVQDKSLYLNKKYKPLEAERRIDILHLEYEILRLQSHYRRRGWDDTSSRNLAIGQIPKLTGVREITRGSKSQVYLSFMEYDFGLGLILMLGNSRLFWEHKLPQHEVRLIVKYCEEYQKQVIDAARTLTPFACRMLEHQFRLCNIDPTELAEDGHIFSRYFSQPCHGLGTPAAVALEVRSTDSSYLQALEDQATMIATSTPQAAEQIQAILPPLQVAEQIQAILPLYQAPEQIQPPFYFSGNHSGMVTHPSAMTVYSVRPDDKDSDITDQTNSSERMYVPGHLTRPAAPPMLEPPCCPECVSCAGWRPTF